MHNLRCESEDINNNKKIRPLTAEFSLFYLQISKFFRTFAASFSRCENQMGIQHAPRALRGYRARAWLLEGE